MGTGLLKQKSKSLVPHKAKLKWALNGGLVVGPFHFSERGMTVKGDASFDQWQQTMAIMKQVEEKIIRPFGWWIGDLLEYGDNHYGDTYTQAIEVTGLTYSTLANAKWVAKQVPPERRRPELSFSHHAETAALSPSNQVKYLEMAVADEMSTMHLRNKIAKMERGEDPTVTCPFCYKEIHVNRKVEVIEAESEPDGILKESEYGLEVKK